MRPTPEELRNKSYLLNWSADEEIEEFISYLMERNFTWKEDKGCFHNKETGFSVSMADFKRFMEDRELLEKEISRSVYEEKKRKEELYHPGNIKAADKVINFLIFFLVANLFLGSIFLHSVLWIVLVTISAFLLFLFIKIRKKIVKKVIR